MAAKATAIDTVVSEATPPAPAKGDVVSETVSVQIAIRRDTAVILKTAEEKREEDLLRYSPREVQGQTYRHDVDTKREDALTVSFSADSIESAAARAQYLIGGVL